MKPLSSGLIGEMLDLVRADIIDLGVPAIAEIVLEGPISLTETAMERSTDEFLGYTGVGTSPRAALKDCTTTFRCRLTLNRRESEKPKRLWPKVCAAAK
jgi:hypothetical protein